MTEQLPPPPSFETQPSVEAVQLIEDNAALYTRLLLGCHAADAVDPNMNIAEIRDDMLRRNDERITTNIEQADYSLYSTASKRERTEKAAVTMDQLPQAVQKWSENTANKMRQFLPVNGENPSRTQKFAQYRETFQRFFGTVAGNGDMSAITPDLMQEVYKRYCENDDNTSDIRLFVVDMVRSFSSDQGGKLVLDEQALMQHSDAIQWMASMFGSQSSEMVTSLIQAEVIAHRHRKTMIKVANEIPAGGTLSDSRVNTLSEREARILTFISGKPYTKTPSPTPLPSPPAPKPPAGVGPSPDQTPPALAAPPEIEIHDVKKLPPPPDADLLSKLLEKDPGEEPIKQPKEVTMVSPEINVAMAQMFAQQLRERIKANDGGNFDPQSGIYLGSNVPKENIDREWFSTGGFIQWAEKNNVPLVFWIRGGHATLLLAPPERVDSTTYRVKIYDPMKQGDQQEQFVVDSELNQYMFTKKREYYDKYFDATSNSYKFPVEQSTGDIKILGHSVAEDKIDEYIFSEWLTQNKPRSAEPNYNAQGLSMLANGTYNLDVSGDKELHDEVIHSKVMATQKNGWDCIPLSFYAAAMRFAALSTDTKAVQEMNDAFARDFQVRFLTKEELKKRKAA